MTIANLQVEDLLSARIVATLNWAAEVVDTSAADETWAPNDSSIVRPLDKMLAEAALFAHLAARALPDHPAVGRLLDAISGKIDDLDRTYNYVVARPHLWDSVGFVWIILDFHERGDQVKRARLHRLWKSSLKQPHEAIPFRALDHAWARGIALGRNDPLLSSKGLYDCTALANIEAGLHMNSVDLYAVTHSAMYLTDFGRASGPAVGPGWVIPLGLSRLHKGDFDLAAEIMLTEIVLDGNNQDIGMRTIASALASQFATHGYVPSPMFDRAQYQKEPSDSYLAFNTYHTTFVFGIVCSVLSLKRISDDHLALLLSSGRVDPSHSDGRYARDAPIEEQVAHTFHSWSEIAETSGGSADNDRLLRHAIDVYILRSVSDNNLTELKSLFAMARIAGDSPIHAAAWALLRCRSNLTGYSLPSNPLSLGTSLK